MKPTIIIILDTRSKKKSGRSPAKLRVTFNRKQLYYSLQIDFTPSEFDLVQNPGKIPKSLDTASKRQYKEWKLTCDAHMVKAQGIIDKSDDFTFRKFEQQFYNTRRPAAQDVYQWYSNVIEKMKADGKIGTASNYQSSKHSLMAFSSKLTLRDISPEVLKEYEKWLMAKGKSITTVGIYLRPLRAIMNLAIEDGAISRESHYPFGKRKYQIPTGKNIKKALSLEEIGKLYRYEAISGSWYEKARDFSSSVTWLMV